MKTITFTVHTCGMSEGTFSEKIMIYAPLATYEKCFCYEDIAAKTVGELVEIIKNETSIFRNAHIVDLCVDRVYILIGDTLFGLQEDKYLDDIYEFFSADNLRFVCFFVAGASIHCSGYRFTVHTDEDIHRHTPHVHVCKDGNSVRYSLVTLERFAQDPVPRSYIRDEKKVILPYLKKNQTKLMNYWNCYINGYTVPDEDEYSRQYYPES